MGGQYPQFWRLELWEHKDFSPVREYLELLSQTNPKAHRLTMQKIKKLVIKPVATIEKAGDFRPREDGMWELRVSAGSMTHYFWGPLEQSSWGPTLVALEVLCGDNESARLVAISLALGRLLVYQQEETRQHNLYGLQ